MAWQRKKIGYTSHTEFVDLCGDDDTATAAAAAVTGHVRAPLPAAAPAQLVQPSQMGDDTFSEDVLLTVVGHTDVKIAVEGVFLGDTAQRDQFWTNIERDATKAVCDLFGPNTPLAFAVSSHTKKDERRIVTEKLRMKSRGYPDLTHTRLGEPQAVAREMMTHALLRALVVEHKRNMASKAENERLWAPASRALKTESKRADDAEKRAEAAEARAKEAEARLERIRTNVDRAARQASLEASISNAAHERLLASVAGAEVRCPGQLRWPSPAPSEITTPPHAQVVDDNEEVSTQPPDSPELL